MSELTRLGESLATDRRGLSLTSRRREKRKCSKCGNGFETDIWIRADGRELPPDELCPQCLLEKRQAEDIERYKQALEDEKKQWRVWWHDQYGVHGLFTEKTFDNFKRELFPKAFDAVKNLKDKSLVLLSPGTYGVGKTHLVCALANHLVAIEETASFHPNSYHIITHRCPVYFTTETKMLARIRQTFNRDKHDGEAEEDVYDSLSSVPLLIIDDVGKVRPRDFSFLQGVYYRVIDGRYVEEKQIILTTNLTLVELEEHIGGACADRLREMCGKGGFITIKGTSYRRK